MTGTVTVNQEGGYKDGILYVTESSQAKDYLLQPGDTYLLATRYSQEQNWYTLNSYPTARETISTDANTTNANLLIVIAHDKRVSDLTAAYPHEIPLQADIAHHYTLNSYTEYVKEMSQGKQEGSTTETSSTEDSQLEIQATSTPSSDSAESSTSISTATSTDS